MSVLIHVPLGDEVLRLHMVVEVSISKEHTLRRRQIRAHELSMASIEAFPTWKVTKLFWNNSRSFVALLLVK